MNKEKQIKKLIRKAKEVEGIKFPSEKVTEVDLEIFMRPKTKVFYFDDVFYREDAKDSLEWLRWTNKTIRPQESIIYSLKDAEEDTKELKRKVDELKKWAWEITDKFRGFVSEKSEEVTRELKEYIDNKTKEKKIDKKVKEKGRNTNENTK